jgi:hypothetical protein
MNSNLVDVNTSIKKCIELIKNLKQKTFYDFC